MNFFEKIIYRVNIKIFLSRVHVKYTIWHIKIKDRTKKD